MNHGDIYLMLIQLDFIDVHDGPQSPTRPSPGRSIRINKSRKSAVARRNLQKSQPPEDDQANKAPFSPPENYEIEWDKDEVEQFMSDWEAKGYLTLQPEKLKWIPFLVSRADRTQALQLDGASLSVDVSAVPRMATEEGMTPDTGASASAGDPTSATLMDLDSVPPVTPNPDEELQANQSSADNLRAGINDVEEAASAEKTIEQDTEETTTGDIRKVNTDGTATETDLGTTEQDEASVDSPSPESMFSMHTAPINALEALAAVASAVSKANPIDILSKTFSSGTSSSRSSDLWGHKNSYSESFKPPSDAKHRSLRPAPLPSISRHGSEKSDVHNLSADQQDQVAGNSASRRMRSIEATSQPATPEPKHERRTSPPLSPSLSPRHSVEKDAEYAAQLAREEEETRHRSLRSGSASNSTPPTLSSRDSRHRAPRSRRNPSPSREPTPTTPVSPNGPMTRRQAQAHARDVEIATTRMTRQKSNKLGINGGDIELRQHVTGLRASTRTNGVSKTPSPAKPANSHSPRARRAVRSNQKQPSPDPVVEVNDDVDAEGESDIDADGEPDEDDSTITLESIQVGGTPVAPDAEMFTPIMNGVTTTTTEATVIHLQPPPGLTNGLHFSVPASSEKLCSPVSPPAPIPGAMLNGDVIMNDEGDDIDAEGELDDEDADGEPDTDVYL